MIIFETVQGSPLQQCVVALSQPHSGYERIMLSLAADAIFAKAKDGSGGAKVSLLRPSKKQKVDRSKKHHYRPIIW